MAIARSISVARPTKQPRPSLQWNHIFCGYCTQMKRRHEHPSYVVNPQSFQSCTWASFLVSRGGCYDYGGVNGAERRRPATTNVNAGWVVQYRVRPRWRSNNATRIFTSRNKGVARRYSGPANAFTRVLDASNHVFAEHPAPGSCPSS